ncbi:MAG: hypothetical protein KF893_09940 [Caldilineaceae bacterium]|nr:hypothetical protein [Caldilineaceae bacterium]
MFGKEKIPGIQAEIAELQIKLQQSQNRAASLLRHAEQQASQLDEHYQPLLRDSLATAQDVREEQPPAWVAGWHEMERWERWQAAAALEPPYLRIGDLAEQRNGNHTLAPGFIPFIGQNRTVIIQTNNQTSDQGLQLLQSLVIRTALLLPHQARYTLVDPAGAGRAFPMRRYLAQVRENSGDVRRDLEGVIVDIQRVIETYLDVQTTSFEKVSHAIRLNEPYQFVFAADFPKNY